MNRYVIRQASIFGVLTTTFLATAQTPLGTAFTYQGRLKDAGSPASGLHDLRFRLYDALSGGAQIGAIVCADNASVTDGLFTVPLDFGAQFAGEERFLEIDVRADTGLDCANPAGFVTLAPRQSLTATPYALFSAGPWQTNSANLSYTAGAVGIGTSIPASLLSVQGGGLDVFDSANQGIALATDSFAITTASNEDPVYQYNFSNDRHRWLTGGSEHMVLNNAGRVGIGTTTPGTRLDVMGGSIRASDQLISTIATGTSPLSVNSTTTVTNLSADRLDGLDSTAFLQSIPVPLTLSGTSSTHIIRGENASTFDGAVGVIGRASAASGGTHGVVGLSSSTSGVGVEGSAVAATGNTHGVVGRSSSTSGSGIYGLASANTGTTYGGRFAINSPDGFAGLFEDDLLGGGLTVELCGPNGAINTNGFLHREYTLFGGRSAAIPIAYGSVSAAGTINGGTGNFTVSHTVTGEYDVTISGETYSNNSFVVTITPAANSPRITAVADVGTAFRVNMWNLSGTLVDNAFQFTVWTENPN